VRAQAQVLVHPVESFVPEPLQAGRAAADHALAQQLFAGLRLGLACPGVERGELFFGDRVGA